MLKIIAVGSVSYTCIFASCPLSVKYIVAEIQLLLESILERLGQDEDVIRRFRQERITPDIISLMSLYKFNCLGINDRTTIMKSRVECVCYRSNPWSQNRTSCANVRFEISSNMIEKLFEAGYSITDTSIALGVSESTLYRKMRQFGLSKLVFTDMDDDELYNAVAMTITEFPRCGEEMLRKVLLQKGIKVQRYRLRQCLKQLDEDGIRARKKRRLRRRIYKVSAPNYLWHIDSNHKLIRLHFVIIGGIDGFSRLVTYLKCTDNNKAETVLRCFRDGVSKFGVPDRVRSDQGRENIKVADFMINTRGAGRGSFVTGKSTHNQRIERLWRDVYDGVLGDFYDLFYFLEDEGLMDILNDIDLFTLHYVFMPKINERLIIWQGHGITIEYEQ